MDPLRSQKSFQQALIRWFESEGKDYPWRRTKDPYAVLVSEMMLQQTQVATVLGKRYFERWLEAFPTPQALADAPEAAILRQWEGLGYYARARNLQKAAREVCALHGGKFPNTFEQLRALPGLGDYTAGAVGSFAMDLPLPIVDANIARVLARLFFFQQEIDSTSGRRQLWEWAAALVPQNNAGTYNSAIMELGQRICTSRQPQCQECPVAAYCRSLGNDPQRLPIKKERRKTVNLTEHVAWAVHDGKLLMKQETGNRRQGLWKLPERTEASFTESLAPTLHRSQYTITHHRVSLQVYEFPTIKPLPDEFWHPLNALTHLPMPSPYRRVVQALLGSNSSPPDKTQPS